MLIQINSLTFDHVSQEIRYVIAYFLIVRARLSSCPEAFEWYFASDPSPQPLIGPHARKNEIKSFT
jgi:hypothetical protein